MSLIGSVDLDDRQLRRFGIALCAMPWMIAAIVYWRWQWLTVPIVLIVISGLLGITFFGIPRSRRAIHRGFMTVTLPLRWLMTVAILGSVFMLIFVPLGCLMRMAGKSVRRIDSGTQSHWSKRSSEADLKRYLDTY
ncbi:MAG: SxtJ family membrane protein [Pirellulales bacterium]|nr:SxtJ family membrane protein [Pirellulales bacterium]